MDVTLYSYNQQPGHMKVWEKVLPDHELAAQHDTLHLTGMGYYWLWKAF